MLFDIDPVHLLSIIQTAYSKRSEVHRDARLIESPTPRESLLASRNHSREALRDEANALAQLTARVFPASCGEIDEVLILLNSSQGCGQTSDLTLVGLV